MTESGDIPGQVFASVWDALEDSPAEAANMRLRSELMLAIRQAVAEWATTQAAAAHRLEVTQPRLNDLLRGRINNFSLDARTVLAARAGLDVRVQIERAAALAGAMIDMLTHLSIFLAGAGTGAAIGYAL